jgi:phytoene dehydrogenase-like protein
VGREHLPDDFLRDHVDNLSTTESVFMVHLGVNYDPSVYQHGSALCYYYLTYDVDRGIRECEEGIYHEGKDGFLIYIPSVHSPGMAPPGHHAVTVYTIAPNNPTNGTWMDDRESWAQKLLDLAEQQVPGLREHLVTKVILTPEEFRQRSHLANHAFGGCPPRLDQTPPKHKTPIEGLWFVGAQSEAYGGVTGAMTGADKVVKMMSG